MVYEWERSNSSSPFPPPRSFFGFTSDGRNLYLSGGIDNAGSAEFYPIEISTSIEEDAFLSDCFRTGRMLNDLFQFDPVGAVWSELSAAVGVSPSARASFGFAAVGGCLYLFGGYDGKGEKQQILFHSSKGRIDLVLYVTCRKQERLLLFQLVNK